MKLKLFIMKLKVKNNTYNDMSLQKSNFMCTDVILSNLNQQCLG